jgi:hypothetical protein
MRTITASLLSGSLVLLAVAAMAAGCANRGEQDAEDGVPAPVVTQGVTLQAGRVPERLITSVTDQTEGLVSAADRANGVRVAYTVSWSGIERGEDGHAEDASGSFIARGLASGAWHLYAENLLDALCNADGSFATTGEDLPGVYTGVTGRHGYGEIRMDLKRAGTSHIGMFRYTVGNEERVFRVVALHRVRAQDAWTRKMNSRTVLWTQELEPSRGKPEAAPEGTVRIENDAVELTSTPPGRSGDVTLRRARPR